MRATTPIASLLLGPLFASFAASVACTPYQPGPGAEEKAGPPARSVEPVPEPLHLDRRAGAAASVAGTIRDHGGQPLAGAQVCAWNTDPHAVERAPRCVETDAAGAYELAGLVPTRHEVHAGGAGRQPIGLLEPVSLQPGERRVGVDLQLVDDGVEVSGIVRDAGGQAVAGAWVDNFDHDASDPGERRGGAAATRTDASGRFTLWLSPGWQTLVARADGFASARLGHVAAPGRYTLELERESTLAGRVVDARTGAPVTGARVAAIVPGSQLRAGLAYTDADGRYAIVGLPSGLYRPRAEAPGRRGEGPRTVYLAPGAAAAPQAIALEPAASVSGRLVVAGAQQTCSRGHVSLRAAESPEHALVELAGPAGEVYFPAVRPGTYFVEAVCPGAVAPPGLPPIEIAEAPVRDRAWEFAIGRTIRGVVVDAQGRPIAGAVVTTRPVKLECEGNCFPPIPGAAGRRCQADDGCAMDEICDNGQCVFSGAIEPAGGGVRPSDAAGRFVVTGLPPGTYEVSPAQPGAIDPTPVRVELARQDAEEVRIVGSQPGTLGGVVVDARGAPLAGVHVDVLADRGTYLSHVVSASTDDAGRFAVFDVRPGDYRVRARASAQLMLTDPLPPLLDDIRARVDARAPAEVKVTLAGGSGQIRGQVRGPDGAPMSAVMVRARLESTVGEPYMPREYVHMDAADQRVRTDAAGEFTLDGLVAGTYTVWTNRGGGVGEVLREQVAIGSKVALTLPAVVGVAGQLAGETPEKFTIRLHGHDNEISRVDTFERTGGQWAFEGLPPGTYELHYEESIARGVVVVELGERPLEGVALPVALPGGIRGRVLDAETRVPLTGVQVKVVREGPAIRHASWPMEGITDDNGRFELEGLPPGKLTLTFPAYVPGELAATVESGKTAEVWSMLRLAPIPARP